MSDRDGPLANGERERASGPPLARDLAGVGTGYTWKFGDGVRAAGEVAAAPEAEEGSELEAMRARVRQLTTALEDVVALALSGADYKERAIMMHRRAVAALSGPPGLRPGR